MSNLFFFLTPKCCFRPTNFFITEGGLRPFSLCCGKRITGLYGPHIKKASRSATGLGSGEYRCPVLEGKQGDHIGIEVVEVVQEGQHGKETACQTK